MARYDEAQADYREFADVMRGIGKEISGEELMLKEDLDRRAAAGDDSEQKQRDELMRAIDVSATSIHTSHDPKLNNTSQARGFIFRSHYRATFPLPPPDEQERLGPDFDPGSMTLSFDTLNSKPNHHLPDPNLTLILIPVIIRAPFYFPNPNDKQAPFWTREEKPVCENKTIGSFIDGLFTSVAAFSHEHRASLPSAMAHDRGGVVVMISFRGRMFKIPRETTIKDVVAGARWPRQSNAPTFEDLRQTPRRRSDEIDGIDLMRGWMIVVYVVAKDKLGEL